MRCQRCQFENVPGQTICLRCGSVLVATAAVLNIHPPRMAGWKRPFRAAIRWLRLHNPAPEQLFLPHLQGEMKTIMHGFVGIILSVIPGLAHLIDRRFKEIRGYVLVWFIALAAGIFLYGSVFGFLLLGLAVSLHTWIAFSHTLNKEASEPDSRFAGLAVLLLLAALFYWGIRRTAFKDFVWGYTNLNIPYHNIETGDCLLARYSRARDNILSRGSLVLARLRTGGGHNGVSPYRMIVQIVGLPGEKIEIANNTFIVNGKGLDADRFPVPKWLKGRTITGMVPGGSYFVGCEYNVYAHGQAPDNGDIFGVCTVAAGDIEARAVMRWLPLWRRGFLEEIE